MYKGKKISKFEDRFLIQILMYSWISIAGKRICRFFLNLNMSYLGYGITTGRSFKKIHRRKQRIIEAKIHKIIADLTKFRLDLRKTFQNEQT